MARHNRDGHGADQRGYEYQVGYQPDWLRMVKVTRSLGSGRQSTKTLFRNPAECREAKAGDRVRTRVECLEQGLDFELALTDPHHRVTRVRVAYAVLSESGRREEVEFTLDGQLPSPP